MTVAQRFGANLARYRTAADLTQEETSFAADLHRTEIGLLERGRRIPRIDTLIKLAATVGVKPEDLLEGIAWEPGIVRVGRFVEMELPGLGTVHRKIRHKRPTRKGG